MLFNGMNSSTYLVFLKNFETHTPTKISGTSYASKQIERQQQKEKSKVKYRDD